MLDGCTVGTTWELLSLLRDARGLSAISGMRCQSNAQYRKLSSPRVLNLVSRLLIHEVPGGCARWRLGRFVFINERNAGYESNCRNSSIYIPSSRLHCQSLFLPHLTHRHHPQLSWHHVTCIKQGLSFQNTLDNLHNFVRSHCSCFPYMQLYHNAIASDVDSFSTHSDGATGQLHRKEEGNGEGENTDIGYESTTVVASGPYKGIHLGIHSWTHTDLQCSRASRMRWPGTSFMI